MHRPAPREGTLRRAVRLAHKPRVVRLGYTVAMTIEVTGPIWFWKGPAPWYFVTVPAEQSRPLQAVSGHVTYGWGMIPVEARIGRTTWRTSLFPKDGCYIVPIKARVRAEEQLAEGDSVTIQLVVG